MSKNFRRTLSAAAALSIAFTMTACGADSSEKSSGTDSTSAAADNDNKLVVWTLAEDLVQFGEKYEADTGKDIEVVVIAPADYPTKLTAALGSGSDDPDVIVGEPQMLPDFFDAGFFEDLSQAPYYAANHKDKIVDYIYEAGCDENGAIRALSYQITPGSIIYRRDIAEKIWGNDDPEFISEKFASYEAIETAAKDVQDAGYRIFGDTGALRWFANASAPWVQDGKLVLSDSRMEYFDAAVNLYQKEQVAFAPEWSAAWYASMSGELPVNAGWSDLADISSDTPTTEILAYAMPSWGAVIIRDNAGDNNGKFGVASGPCSFFGGGTFLGISSFSDCKEEAWDFVQYCTVNEETAKWWIDKSNGDVVSLKSVLEENKDYENAAFGNQKTYQFFLEEANNIDYSKITRYDTQIDNAFGAAISSVQEGAKTKEEALQDFYDEVSAQFPEIELPQ